MEIVSLAASIKRDGLTNPVTVSPKGQQYQLETGERRWLAYHLLLLYTQDDKWKRIPARVMDTADPWRQASENTVRQDLNAIGRARQFAKLLMALHPNREFAPYEECESDQAYYQQAVDLRPPYGTSELLLNAMGLKHRAAFSRCRKLLNLPPDIWIQADDENWPEDRLIEIVATRNDSVIPSKPPTPPADDKRSEFEPLISRDKRRDFGKFLKLAHKAGQGDVKARRTALGYIAEQRKWLDEVERWLQYGE